MENELNPVGIAPSPVMAPHLAHLRALKPLEHLPVEMSIAIPKEGLDGPLLGDLVASMSKGAKRFAMTEHESVFEIMRFPDGYDLNLFYKHDRFCKVISDSMPVQDKQIETLIRACESYFSSPWGLTESYCVGIPQQVHTERVLPYAYLQRKLASVAIFRRDRNGSNMALKQAILKLIDAGFLREVPRHVLQKKFSIGMRCFQFSMTKQFPEL